MHLSGQAIPPVTLDIEAHAALLVFSPGSAEVLVTGPYFLYISMDLAIIVFVRLIAEWKTFRRYLCTRRRS